MPDPTPRLALSKPVGADGVTQLRLSIDNHADALDAAALDLQGTLAARPPAGTQGRYFFATDAAALFRDDGTSWVEIQVGPIGTSDLANGAVTTDKIADGTINKGDADASLLGVIGQASQRSIALGSGSITIAAGTVTANVAGFVHGLGKTPIAIFLQSNTQAQGTFPGATLASYAYTSTTFSVSAYSADYSGGIVVSFSFLAIG